MVRQGSVVQNFRIPQERDRTGCAVSFLFFIFYFLFKLALASIDFKIDFKMRASKQIPGLRQSLCPCPHTLDQVTATAYCHRKYFGLHWRSDGRT